MRKADQSLDLEYEPLLVAAAVETLQIMFTELQRICRQLGIKATSDSDLYEAEIVDRISEKREEAAKRPIRSIAEARTRRARIECLDALAGLLRSDSEHVSLCNLPDILMETDHLFRLCRSMRPTT